MSEASGSHAIFVTTWCYLKSSIYGTSANCFWVASANFFGKQKKGRFVSRMVIFGHLGLSVFQLFFTTCTPSVPCDFLHHWSSSYHLKIHLHPIASLSGEGCCGAAQLSLSLHLSLSQLFPASRTFQLFCLSRRLVCFHFSLFTSLLSFDWFCLRGLGLASVHCSCSPLAVPGSHGHGLGLTGSGWTGLGWAGLAAASCHWS